MSAIWLNNLCRLHEEFPHILSNFWSVDWWIFQLISLLDVTGVSESIFTAIYRQIPVCTSTANYWSLDQNFAVTGQKKLKDHRKIYNTAVRYIEKLQFIYVLSQYVFMISKIKWAFSLRLQRTKLMISILNREARHELAKFVIILLEMLESWY